MPMPTPEPRMVEKNTDHRLEMEFSTPIQEVMGGADFEPEETMPVIDDGLVQRPRKEGYRAQKESAGPTAPMTAGGKNPFGLTDDQFQAALAGLAAVIAFSRPVQDKIGEVLPQVVGQGLMSQAFMLALTAVIFMLAKRFLAGK